MPDARPGHQPTGGGPTAPPDNPPDMGSGAMPRVGLGERYYVARQLSSHRGLVVSALEAAVSCGEADEVVRAMWQLDYARAAMHITDQRAEAEALRGSAGPDGPKVGKAFRRRAEYASAVVAVGEAVRRWMHTDSARRRGASVMR